MVHVDLLVSTECYSFVHLSIVVRMFRLNHFVNFRHVVPVISINRGNMSRFYCTAGRGTETFASNECKNISNSSEVSSIDGKVFFTCNENVTAKQINRLKTVERIFVQVNYMSASEINRKDKHTFIQSLCEKLLNKDEVTAGFHTYRRLFATSKESDCSDEPAVKKPRHEDDEDNNGSIHASPTFRISCKISGRFKGSIHTQHLSQKLGAKLIRSLGWKVDLKHPQIEICVHINDEHVVAGIPTSKIPVSKRDYIAHPGLRSTISWIICHLADIKAGDVVLDPMCGKATILVEGAVPNQTGVFLGCDNNSNQLKHAVENRASARLESRLHFVTCSSLALPFKSASIDRVVCDAPFGQKFTTDITLEDFYTQLLTEILRVLKINGKAVVMTSSEMRSYVIKHLHTSDQMKTMSSSSEKLDTPCDTKTNTTSLDEPKKVTKDPIQPASNNWKERSTGSRMKNSSQDHHQDVLENMECSEKPNTESSVSEIHTKNIIVSDTQSDSCNNTERESIEKTVVSGAHSVSTGAKHNTGSGSRHQHTEKGVFNTVPLTDAAFSKMEETSDLLTQIDGVQFVLLEDHYVKLGETSAYIIVMQKQTLIK